MTDEGYLVGLLLLGVGVFLGPWLVVTIGDLIINIRRQP